MCLQSKIFLFLEISLDSNTLYTICFILHLYENLIEIDLSYNNITEKGIIYLSEIIYQNKLGKIKKLILGANSINDKGFTVFCNSINEISMKNLSFLKINGKKLDKIDNMISNIGFSSLYNMISKNSEIKLIDLDISSIDL